MIALLGAAARDPAACKNPDAIDVGRKEKSYLFFGRGIHFCLGVSKAMLEVRIAFRGVLDRFPSIRTVAKPGRGTVSSFAASRACGSRSSPRGSPLEPDTDPPRTHR